MKGTVMAMGWRVLTGAAVLACVGMTGFAEEVDNPAYVSWAKYKPGTTVTLKQAMDMPSMPTMKNETTTTQKLVEVKPEGAVVEVTSKITVMGQTREQTEKMTIKAKVEKGSENLPPQLADQKAQVKDMKEGKETVEVKGQKVETTTREFTMTLPMGGRGGMGEGGGGTTAHVKIWNAPEVPGNLVKMEQTTDTGPMGTVKMTTEVADYTVVK